VAIRRAPANFADRDASVPHMAASGLEGWRSLLERSRRQLMEQLGANEGHVHAGVAYEGLGGLDRVYVPSAHPAHFYLAGDHVAIIYSADSPVQDAAALQAVLGGAGLELRSRAGSRAVMHVYPAEGIAFSAEDGRVQFVELFPPLTPERYRAEIYRDPGPFIR
jgi:hypothetical protein